MSVTDVQTPVPVVGDLPLNPVSTEHRDREGESGRQRDRQKQRQRDSEIESETDRVRDQRELKKEGERERAVVGRQPDQTHMDSFYQIERVAVVHVFKV